MRIRVRSFGWDRKNRGPVSQQVWHDKDPSLLKGLERCMWAWPKFFSPSPVWWRQYGRLWAAERAKISIQKKTNLAIYKKKKKKKLINDSIYLINGRFFVTNIHEILINDLVRNQQTYLQNKRLSLHNKRLSLHNERLSSQNEQCLILNKWYCVHSKRC
jgi:hypothetical protein